MINDILDAITVNEQSSIRIAACGKVIYFDPFHIKDAARDADAVFITHTHFDHFSPEDIAKVSNPSTVFIIPSSAADEVTKAGLPADRLVTMMPGSVCDVCGFRTEAIPAYNRLKPFHPKSRGWLGYTVEINGVRIYVAGDTDATDEAKAVRCNIALLPIGGTYTTDARKAAELAETIAPDIVIPIHYGTVVGGADAFDKFAADVKTPRVVRKIEL